MKGWTMKSMLLVVMALVYVCTFLVHLGVALAQDAPAAAAEPAWKQLLTMAISSLVPAIWVAVGPMAVAAVTKGVNMIAGSYVPRPLQVVLSGLFTAIVAGLSGDVSMIAQAAGTGVGSQILAATKPETLLTSGRPDGA